MTLRLIRHISPSSSSDASPSSCSLEGGEGAGAPVPGLRTNASTLTQPWRHVLGVSDLLGAGETSLTGGGRRQHQMDKRCLLRSRALGANQPGIQDGKSRRGSHGSA